MLRKITIENSHSGNHAHLRAIQEYFTRNGQVIAQGESHST